MEPNQTLTPEQRSSGWFEQRLGRATASRAGDTMEYYAPSKADLAKAQAQHEAEGTDPEWAQYLLENHPFEYCLSAGVELREKEVRRRYREALVAERLTGQLADPEPYMSYDMKWGVANEMIARNVYQLEQQKLLADAPFVAHKDPKIMAGASPDGWVIEPSTGEVLASAEIKCLRSANHLYKAVLTQEVPKEYLPQIYMQMWITNMPRAVFIAYDSRVPEGLKIFTATVERDERYMKVLESNILRFLDECANDFKHFWAMVKSKPALENGVVKKEVTNDHRG